MTATDKASGEQAILADLRAKVEWHKDALNKQRPLPEGELSVLNLVAMWVDEASHAASESQEAVKYEGKDAPA